MISVIRGRGGIGIGSPRLVVAERSPKTLLPVWIPTSKTYDARNIHEASTVKHSNAHAPASPDQAVMTMHYLFTIWMPSAQRTVPGISAEETRNRRIPWQLTASFAFTRFGTIPAGATPQHKSPSIHRYWHWASASLRPAVCSIIGSNENLPWTCWTASVWRPGRYFQPRRWAPPMA